MNYNKTDVVERTIPAAIDVRRSLNIENLSPRWRGVLAESCSSGMFDATARLNYYGAITAYNDNPVAGVINPDRVQDFRPDWSFDLEVGVTFAQRFRVAASAENLFNRYPERDARNLFSQTGAAANGRIYNDAFPLSYMGGFWYVRASAKF